MKIENVNKNNYINFKNNSKTIKKEEINRQNKFDRIDIKAKNITEDESANIKAIKKKIVSKINEETDIGKIKRIKEEINNKTYTLDAEEIARKLLK